MAEKCLPRRECRKRHGRRVDVVERFRLGLELVRMEGNQFRRPAITIERSEAVSFFANFGDLRIGRKLFDYTGKFVTGNLLARPSHESGSPSCLSPRLPRNTSPL